MVQEKDEVVKKRVLYIGSAVPLETAEGLDGVQKPLLERYPVDDDNNIEGILSHISVLKSGGITLQYDSDPGRILFFPISSLIMCAAVRCVTTINSATGEKTAQFVSLSSPAAGGANSKRPAIFTTITRRTEGKKVLECHGFVCSSDKDTMELVEWTSFVDRLNKGKISGAGTPRETSTMKSTSASASGASVAAAAAVPDADGVHPVRLVAGDSVSQRVAPEFYEPPPQHGYFYKTRDSQIKTYTVERVVEGEAERLRAISSNARVTSPRGPVGERRSMHGVPPPGIPPPGVLPPGVPPPGVPPPGVPPPGLMTMPHPQGRHLIPVRVLPPQATLGRPRFFSPPPPMLRPQPMAMPPRQMVGADPYMFLPPPVTVMDPSYVVREGPPRRGRSHSSSSASSSPGSPTEVNGQQAMNGNRPGGSSDVSSRPHTPPTDYEKGPRVSRKDQFEQSRRYLREVNAGPVHYSTLPGGPAPPMPYPYMYMYAPRYPYAGYPPYMMERARSVPAPVDRARSKDSKKKRKGKKEKRKSGKHKHDAPSDVSTDSVGYTSEVGPTGDYPRMPRDFRRFENQFKHERAFSKSLKEEGTGSVRVEEESGNAYSLNERMSKRKESDFHLY